MTFMGPKAPKITASTQAFVNGSDSLSVDMLAHRHRMRHEARDVALATYDEKLEINNAPLAL